MDLHSTAIVLNNTNRRRFFGIQLSSIYELRVTNKNKTMVFPMSYCAGTIENERQPLLFLHF